jgi:hypothetical protein
VIVAHVGGVPVEELLPTLAGTGTGLLVARAWLTLRLRRRRDPGRSLRRLRTVASGDVRDISANHRDGGT